MHTPGHLSYWLKNSRRHSQQHYDFLIIGGGLSGVALAYWLTRLSPSSPPRVAILEKNHIAAGASGRNAGFLTSGSATFFKTLLDRFGAANAQRIWNYAQENFQLLRQEIIADASAIQAVDYEEYGSLTLGPLSSAESPGGPSTDPSAVPHSLQELAQLLQQNEISHQVLTGQHLKRYIDSPLFHSGIWMDHEASLDPVKLLDQMLRKIPQVQIKEGVEVFEHGEDGVITPQGVFRAPKIIYCLNAHTPQVLSSLQAEISPVRAQVLAIPYHKRILWGNFYYSPHKVYFRQLPDHTVIIGGFRHLEEAKEVGYGLHTTHKIQKALEKFLKECLPPLRQCQVQHRWAGIMGFNKRELPYCHAHENSSSVYVMGVYSGHGLGYSFKLAQEMVEIITGKRQQSTFDQCQGLLAPT